MRHGPVLLLTLSLLAMAVLPGMALAQDGHDHAHGGGGPTNPMKKSATLFLDAANGFAMASPELAAVPAGPAMPLLTQAVPVVWSTTATKNTILASSVFVEFSIRVDQVSVVPSGPLGGPDGAAFVLELLHNDTPVDGVTAQVRADSTLLTPGADPIRYRVFLPQPETPLAFAPGDTVGLGIRFFGLNPENSPTVSYLVGGGDTASRMVLSLQMASLAELNLPAEIGPWDVAPLDGFDFEAAQAENPEAAVFTLRAFQFGFDGAPIEVDNGTDVILHLYVDESLSTSGEGHEGHDHGGGDGHAMAWDENMVTAVHGFSLHTLDPGLATVLFDNLVVTMRFTADQAGNHSFICTVFCGTGHAGMDNVLTVLGEEPSPEDLAATQNDDGADTGDDGSNAVPGPGLALFAAALFGAALVARRGRAGR